MQTSPPDPSVCINSGAAPAPEVSRAPNAAEVVREARESETADAPMGDNKPEETIPSEHTEYMVLFVEDIILRVSKTHGIEKLLYQKDHLVKCWFGPLVVIPRTLQK